MNPAKQPTLIFRCVALLCLLFIALLTANTAKAQANKVYGELQILNGTKNVNGYLYNTGNGITIFKNPSLDFSLSWDSITGKPLTFPPSVHTHSIAEILHLADSLSTLRALINTKLSVESDPLWHADSSSYYKKVAADARFYPLASNPANYITLGSLSGTSPLIYNNLTGAFVFDTSNHHTVGYYDTRYVRTATFTANKIVSGGVITKLSDYSYNISASTYFIDGVFYSSPSTNVTLSSPAASLDRIDLFVLTTSGAALALGGTPSNNPVPATYNVTNQLPISFAYIKSIANGNTPPPDSSIVGTPPWICHDTTFTVFSDESTNGINGPAPGDSTFAPQLNTYFLLINRSILLLVRNNITLTPEVDYAFNSSSGTITFTQPVQAGEGFIIHSGCTPTSTETAQVIDTSNIIIEPPLAGGSSNFRGVWGIGDFSSSNLTSLGQEWKGYHVTRLWSEIETSDGVYNWTALDNDLDEIEAAGLYASVQIQVGPSAPSFVMSGAGTYTTTSGTYPKYYSAYYKTKYYALLQAAAIHLATRPEVLAWQIAEGSTGDTGPDHGTLSVQYVGDPLVPQSSTEPKWKTFRYDAWAAADSYLTTPLRLLINTGNDGEDVEYVRNTYPTAWIKAGDVSHSSIFSGSALYFDRPVMVSRGEVQGDIFNSTHEMKDAFQLAVSAVTLNLSMFNTPGGWYNQMIGSDRRPNYFFNKYANDTAAETSTKAFIQMGRLVSLDDLTVWPEDTYGNLVTNTTDYNNTINSINNNTSWGATYKNVKKLKARQQYINATRRTNIINANSSNGSLYNPTTTNDYENDFVFSAPQYYSKFIATNPNSIKPFYRQGSDTSMYGRLCAEINGTEISFDIDNAWASHATTANIQFDVWYLDDGAASWSIQANTGTGMMDVATQTNTGTGKWLKKTATVNNMVLGTSTDFKLKYSSSTTKFTLIEILKTS
jgi:hypothetical protein